ncbi:MAG: hypothetical protein ACJA0S_000417 [Rickettsiales bacterium]|jgi:hypothetical protein
MKIISSFLLLISTLIAISSVAVANDSSDNNYDGKTHYENDADDNYSDASEDSEYVESDDSEEEYDKEE